MHFANSLRPA